jgi:signal peptidase II
MSRRWKIFLIVAVAAIALDQGSKLWARQALTEGHSVPLIDGFWDWRLSFNHGASFNLLESVGGARVILSVLGLAALGAIAWMVARARDDAGRTVVGLGLIFGGAAGNLIDRIGSGVVTDFALWHWKDRAFWPMFNVADAALVIGVALLLLSGGPRPTPAARP